LNDLEKMVELLRRSFFAVDGLWFVNLEKRSSFETALKLDQAVWKSMAKIQARKCLELTGSEKDLRGLGDCLDLKFRSEGWEYDMSHARDALEVQVKSCPWLRILERSGRGEMEPVIANAICKLEYTTWAEEFGGGIHFSHSAGSSLGTCSLTFRRDPDGRTVAPKTLNP